MEPKHAATGCVMCIDLKSFYASVECADRGLDPFTTNLVVADPDRSANTICLAITPAMKALDVKNRCRVRDIPEGIDYHIAVPRMRRYMEASGQIVAAYLELVSAEDVHVYSIDECFIDVAPYLRLYRTDARRFARKLMDAAYQATGVTATAGIGENMFQAKVALDVCAKHAADGIAQLDAELFKREVWFHRPITDIWGIGPGIARRLAKHGAYDLAGVCATNPKVLHREFGKNAEYLIDHAWGLETCTVSQARSYRPRGHSLSNGQVLMRDYAPAEAETLLREMTLTSSLELVEKGLCAQVVSVWAGYSASNFPHQSWEKFGPCGSGASGAGGSAKLPKPTNDAGTLTDAVLAMFRARVAPNLAIRRLNVAFDELVDANDVQPTLFDDDRAEKKAVAVSRAMVDVRRRFGANALMKATSLKEEANGMERNNQVGGHRA